MTASTSEKRRQDAIPFRDSHWTTKWLFVGLAFLFVWRSCAFLDFEWFPRVPWWVGLVVTGLIPEVFLLLFPVYTRRPKGRIFIPKPTRCLIEFGIAIPVVIFVIAALAGADYLLTRLSPGTSLEPDVITRMAESSQPKYVYTILLFWFTLVPIAEEVFCRGFLHNAFRQRMPLTLAIIAQSLIFGVCHSFSVLHSGAAFFLGLLLTLLYEWRKTLVAPIFVHAGLNAVAALGVVAMSIDYANSPVLGVTTDPNDSACVIRQVMPNSAADIAGLREGDIVISFDGQAIRDFPHLAETVRQYQPGDTVPVSINRAGSLLEVNVILQRRGTQ